MKKYFVLIFLLASFKISAGNLKPFKSDGCSAFPDGTLVEQNLWFDCCYHHDIAYWQGGTAEKRQEVDTELKNCVAQVGKPMLAKLMLAGVRVGGTPYLPTKFRWGYGWPYFRGYKIPTAAENMLIQKALNEINQKPRTLKNITN